MKHLVLTILAAIPLLAETPWPRSQTLTSGFLPALAHIADGGQWTTTFTLVNLDTVPAPYTRLTFTRMTEHRPTLEHCRHQRRNHYQRSGMLLTRKRLGRTSDDWRPQSLRQG